ncbi:TPA: hypothetical protein O8U54_000077 [Enterobacter cloacae]|uniref:hypothetical protein n=1 Tax=Enterobacter cloacae TaxID=550 RepID=UPI00197E1D00|nr:hypothetical protein [Enterobacter cloacae]MBN4759743.1 hypothetical protein [Enterobacter cloacae]HDC4681197.1 hypothetical protein [Enterobacter cloacae]
MRNGSQFIFSPTAIHNINISAAPLGIKRNGKLSGFVQSAMFDTRSAEYSTKVFW